MYAVDAYLVGDREEGTADTAQQLFRKSTAQKLKPGLELRTQNIIDRNAVLESQQNLQGTLTRVTDAI